jgi:AMMECR1 domain-containing protein
MTFTINPREKQILLDQARESILSKFERRQCKNPEKEELQGVLQEPCGAFVTLHKNGDLRGCIGRMTANSALLETVRDMARERHSSIPVFPLYSAKNWTNAVLKYRFYPL